MSRGRGLIVRILFVLSSTLAFAASAWNRYSSDSLVRVQPNLDSRGVSSEVADKSSRTESLLRAICEETREDEERQRQATLKLVLEIESQVLASGEAVHFAPGVARSLALAEWDRLMALSVTKDLPDKFKSKYRNVVSDRFTTEHEFVTDAARLEASRRNRALRRSRVKERDDFPIDVFQEQIAQSLMTPMHQRVTTRAFWNLTEAAFDRLQHNCKRLSECESDFNLLLQKLKQRGAIDRPTEQKLRGVFHLRIADRALLGWFGRQSEELHLAKGANKPKLLTVGFLAAENTASTLASGSLSPKGLVIALGAFFTAFLITLILASPKMPFT